MPDPTVWNSVPQIVNGQPVNAAVANSPSLALTSRTDALRAILQSIEAGEQLVLRDAPLAASLAAGTTVYFDASSLTHTGALAIWESLESTGGRLFPAASAVYTGVIISKAADRVGDVLMNGLAQIDSAAETVLFDGVAPVAGETYYLSMLTAGTVQIDDPAMAVRVLQYLGSGLIRVFPPQTEPVTHTHQSYSLDIADWALVASFDPNIVPVGALHGYDLTTAGSIAQSLSESILPSVGEPQFTYLYTPAPTAKSGLHVSDALILLDANGIWWFDATAPVEDIDMTVTSADAKGEALLHAIQSDDILSLVVSTANGRVTLSPQPFTSTAATAGYLVVKSITGHDLKIGPVVESISVGAGLTRTSPEGAGQGTVTITQTLHDNVLIPAALMNLNNAITSGEAPFVYTLFPTGRTSVVDNSLTLPNLSDATYEMKVWAQFLNPGASEVGPAISVVLVATPDAAGVTPAGAVPLVFPAFPGSISAGDIYYVESTATINLAGYSRGTVTYSLTATSPTTELRMINTGVILTIV